ncbi:MAG: bifunctional folylpolyglutamate synthase/dihydrofolate synthase [Spirochaetales bacterium]
MNAFHMQSRTSLQDADEGFSWIESFTNLERGGYRPREYRLERMSELLETFGSPHLGIPTIHIAGSKGKGSTAALVDSGLRALGFRTGMYSSPHVSDYRERIRVNAQFADERVLLEQMRKIFRTIEPLRDAPDSTRRLPTTFELLTLLAFLVFQAQRCEWVVLETGLGGRLDATNLCTPDLCIITPIELEHTEYLGDTLPEIAREKAGIFKHGVPAITSPQFEDVDRTLSLCAKERGVTLRRTQDHINLENIQVGTQGTTAQLSDVSEIGGLKSGRKYTLFLSMPGTAQAENAATAFFALRTVFPEADPVRILKGLGTAAIPGRAELIRGNPSILLDGAHTAGSMRRFAHTVESMSGSPRVLIFGSVEGKPVEPMAVALDSHVDHVIVSRPGSFKRSNPEAVAEVFSALRAQVELLTDPATALARARSLAGKNGTVIVTGSFYMVCEIRALVGRTGIDG